MNKKDIEKLGWKWVNPVLTINGIEITHPSLGNMYFLKGEYSLNIEEEEVRIAKGFDYIFEGGCASIEELISIQNNLNI